MHHKMTTNARQLAMSYLHTMQCTHTHTHTHERMHRKCPPSSRTATTMFMRTTPTMSTYDEKKMATVAGLTPWPSTSSDDKSPRVTTDAHESPDAT